MVLFTASLFSFSAPIGPRLSLDEMVQQGLDAAARRFVLEACAPYIVHTVLHGDVHYYIRPDAEVSEGKRERG